MSCVFAHVSNIISCWQQCGSAGHESWHVSVQSSPEPHRVHKHPSPVVMTDWKRILSEVPISPFTETHLLTSYTFSVFSDGGVSPEDMSRVVIRRVSVTWSWSPSSWPSSWRALSSSAVTTRCQEWPPPSASVCHLYIFSEETSEEERDKYFIVAKRISSRNQIWVVNR